MGLKHNPIHVLVLTQNQCGFCEQAQDLLQLLAREYELKITTLDIGSEAGQALAVQGGILFPPGIFLDGQPFSYGRQSEMKLRRALKRHMHRPAVGPLRGNR